MNMTSVNLSSGTKRPSEETTQEAGQEGGSSQDWTAASPLSGSSAQGGGPCPRLLSSRSFTASHAALDGWDLGHLCRPDPERSGHLPSSLHPCLWSTRCPTASSLSVEPTHVLLKQVPREGGGEGPANKAKIHNHRDSVETEGWTLGGPPRRLMERTSLDQSWTECSGTPPPFIHWSPNPGCDGVRRWALREVIGS